MGLKIRRALYTPSGETIDIAGAARMYKENEASVKGTLACAEPGCAAPLKYTDHYDRKDGTSVDSFFSLNHRAGQHITNCQHNIAVRVKRLARRYSTVFEDLGGGQYRVDLQLTSDALNNPLTKRSPSTQNSKYRYVRNVSSSPAQGGPSFHTYIRAARDLAMLAEQVETYEDLASIQLVYGQSERSWESFCYRAQDFDDLAEYLQKHGRSLVCVIRVVKEVKEPRDSKQGDFRLFGPRLKDHDATKPFPIVHLLFDVPLERLMRVIKAGDHIVAYGHATISAASRDSKSRSYYHVNLRLKWSRQIARTKV